MRRRLGILAVAGACCLAGGCTTEEVMLAHSVELTPVSQTIPDDQLLDVAVLVFDPGVPDGEIAPEVKEQLLKQGTFVEVRRAESLYLAVQLRDTLQNSMHWGSVWVAPQKTTAADLNVTTKILHSDGDVVKLEVTAVDATGRAWLDGKDYELETAEGAYNRQRYPGLDPYQDVFNRIANDLAAVETQLEGDPTKEIRRVAALRYAEDMSPEAFAQYVSEDKSGRYALNRLPAQGDPMFDRTQRVRQRERLFMDTLNEHYTKFSVDAQDSYDGWRQYAREEAISIRELQKSARWRTGLGIASILASVVYGSSSGHDSFSDRVVRDALMYMGTDVLKSAAVRRQEKKLHTDTLEELSSSFDDEVKPLVVNVQGTEHRLTGTAAAQYQEWRDLLHQMFVSETGFVPEDVQVYEDPETTLAPSKSVQASADGSTDDSAAGSGDDAATGGSADASAGAAAGSGDASAAGSGDASAAGSGDASAAGSGDASAADGSTTSGAAGAAGASAETKSPSSGPDASTAKQGSSQPAPATAGGAATAGEASPSDAAPASGESAEPANSGAEHAAAGGTAPQSDSSATAPQSGSSAGSPASSSAHLAPTSGADPAAAVPAPKRSGSQGVAAPRAEAGAAADARGGTASGA
ncbi:MAG TPA: hypothetical protein VFV10_19620 [Gammaproteobacteria bacterium]|nr:hypothetical protein [Gammaproteobacteria bacterium]